MPLPKPDNDESEKDFIARCMSDLEGEYEDNEQRLAVCYSQWRGKESKEANMVTKTKEAISDVNKRNLLKTALVAEYGLKTETPKPGSIEVEEVFDDQMIYNIDGQLYQASFEIGENGAPSIGDPKKVLSTTVFKPMESLQTTYSEIIQEAGKRNATLDSARVKKILELCQELLSTEQVPDEKKASEALKEAESTLAWLKEQASTKTEDGQSYPASAFAYAPEADKPSGWKLRLWEDIEKKVTRAQLGRAAAALSPGGFRGQKADIPAADLATVKRKIRAEYRKLGVEDDEMSQWTQEAMHREYMISYMPLTEAKFDKGRATVIVIKAGFNADKSRYYPAEMLKRDYGIFEGQKMYADHPTETEDKELPERSIKPGGWVATLKDVTCDENGTVSGVADIIEDWLMKKLANLRDKDMLSEMGISINAFGDASKATIDGTETIVIERLKGARSVDFVTEPGAQGIVTLYEAIRSNDVDLVELATLKERRPDLVKAIEATVRTEILKEAKHMSEQEDKIKELEGQLETATTENTTLKTTIEEAEKAKAKADAQAAIKEAVDKAELPDASKEVLLKRWESAETADGIQEAIQSEIDYIAKLSEAGKVKGMGPTQISTTDKDREALRESFKHSNPEWTDDQLNAAVDGR